MCKTNSRQPLERILCERQCTERIHNTTRDFSAVEHTCCKPITYAYGHGEEKGERERASETERILRAYVLHICTYMYGYVSLYASACEKCVVVDCFFFHLCNVLVLYICIYTTYILYIHTLRMHTIEFLYHTFEREKWIITRPSLHWYIFYGFIFNTGRPCLLHNGPSGQLWRRYRRHFAAIRRRHIATSTRRHNDAARPNCAAATAQSADHHSANACEVSVVCGDAG